MQPVTDMWLNEVISLPEYESIPPDPDEAIRYMAQWDHGEYCCDPISLSEVYTWHGQINRLDDYILYRSYCGDAVLFRRCEYTE